jgi:hypothetical protein
VFGLIEISLFLNDWALFSEISSVGEALKVVN